MFVFSGYRGSFQVSYRTLGRTQSCPRRDRRRGRRVGVGEMTLLETDRVTAGTVPRAGERERDRAEPVRARASVAGKFLYVGDEKFYARVVTYGPFRPGPDGC